MANLTDRQLRLLSILQQLQASDSTASSFNLLPDNFSWIFPNIDVDLGSISWEDGSDNGGDTLDPDDRIDDGEDEEFFLPSTIVNLLLTLLNENVEITTPFGTVSGILIAVQEDYAILIDNGEQVLVRVEKIETINQS